jgi:hypothetical protein
MSLARLRVVCRPFLRAASVAAALWAGCARADQTPTFAVDPHWPAALPNGWVLGEVSGIAVDGQDNVWIVQRSAAQKNFHAAPPVIEFDPAGHVLRAWGGPGAGYDWFGSEHGIYVDPKGFVWLTGNGERDGQVLKFSQTGQFALQIGRPASGAASNDATRLGRPTDVAVDVDAGEAFVSDGYGDRRVIVFDAQTGAFKRLWGAYGGKPSDAAQHYDPAKPPPKQFGRPVHCVKLSADGLVYVCDRQNDRIQIFRKDGGFVAECGQSLALVADGSNETIHVLRRDNGQQIAHFGAPGRKVGQFHWVHTLAIDSHGDVFTTEVDGANRVQRFTPSAPPR